jgi:signal transduction histidine kinase
MRILILSLLFFINLVAYDDNFTAEENKWMKENPIVTYVGDPLWLPFEGHDNNGNYIGIVPDLLQLASNKTPLTFRHVDTKSWQESLGKMADGSVMMISQSRYSNAHTSLLFTETFFKTPVVIVMQQGEDYVSSLHQIKDKRIGLVRNKTTTPIFKDNYPTINFSVFASVEEGMKSLALGEVDAFLCSLPEAGYKIAKMQLSNLRIVGKTEVEIELGFGVNLQYPILHKILNIMISNRSEAAVQSVLSQWTRQDYIEKVDYTALYIALSVFTFISLMGTLFYWRLRRESTARIKAQSMMLQQQSKMASMGEMMDAVAHQWKQPLNALSMYSDLMKSDYEDGRVDKAYVDEMVEGVQTQIEHMTNTLSEFRDFFRPNTDIRVFNLRDVISSVQFLVKDEFLKNSISIEVDIDDGIRLKGNENEFKHLILNVINNAKDAFNEGDVTKRVIKIQAAEEADCIHMSIEDNAGGIPEHVIDHIFEANVTTKEAGKGTGIGLYMSEQIIKKMKGSIKVSNTNQGACFSIKLVKAT